jgi:DNA-binding NtrC family response regulator
LRDRPEDFIPLAEYFLEQYSTRILEKAMRRSNWSQTKASELQGLQRTYLVRPLKQNGIQQGTD